MEASEVASLLTRRYRRGLVIFSTLWLASIIWGGHKLVASNNRSWAAAAFFAAILLGLGFNHARKGFVSAKHVSANPGMVYWAHSGSVRLPFSSRSLNYF